MAKNTATEKSDLDLLVYSNLHGLHFVGFMEEIRQAVHRPVDIQDISRIEPDSRILHEIEESGIVLYEK